MLLTLLGVITGSAGGRVRRPARAARGARAGDDGGSVRGGQTRRRRRWSRRSGAAPSPRRPCSRGCGSPRRCERPPGATRRPPTTRSPPRPAPRRRPGTRCTGPSLRQRWEAAKQSPPRTLGRLRLEPLPKRAVSAVDGEIVELPATLTTGIHLLQVGTSERNFSSAAVFYLPPGLDLVLDPGLTGGIDAVPGGETSPRKRRIVHSLIVGGWGSGCTG